jgi:hypothetical protein
MKFAVGFLAGYWTCALLGLALNWWFKSQTPSITKHSRRDVRGYQPTESANAMPKPPYRREWRDREEGVRYEWINLTGEER